nr:4-coumarate--CoA ligase-like 5 [Ipomoea batatas]
MSIPRICTALAIAALFFFSEAFAEGVVFSPKTTSRRKSAKIEALSSNSTPLVMLAHIYTYSAMASQIIVDSRSGFCTSNTIFYSKRLCSLTSLFQEKIAFIDASTGRQLSFSDVWRAMESVVPSLSDPLAWAYDDMLTLLYSSGTTGASNGVVSSHRNLIAMV